MKEEALKLADYLDNNVEAMYLSEQPHLDKASDMIRKLVAELDKQGEPVAWGEDLDDYRMVFIAEKLGLDPMSKEFLSIPFYTAPQTKPLSDEEIIDTFIKDGIYDCINDPYMQSDGKYSLDGDLIRFARAIEERQGIK